MAAPQWPDRFLKALPKYGTITGAAKAVRVSRSTVYLEMEHNELFAADVRAIQAECVELVEATLYQCANDPDKTADRIFYLKTARPEKYGDRLRADQIEAIKADAKREVLLGLQEEILGLTPEARELVLAALSKSVKGLTP